MNEREVDEWQERLTHLLADHMQAIDAYIALVKIHGGDPMTEESFIAYKKSVDAFNAIVAHREKAPVRN